MARFDIQISVASKARTVGPVVALIEKALGKAKINANVGEAVKKPKAPESRAGRLAEALVLVDDATAEIESLKEELESWRDNLPESLQSGSKADELNEAIDALESLRDGLDSAKQDGDTVNFPGMY